MKKKRIFLFITQSFRLFKFQTKLDGVFDINVFGMKKHVKFKEISLG